jgi:hypothetical protein
MSKFVVVSSLVSIFAITGCGGAPPASNDSNDSSPTPESRADDLRSTSSTCDQNEVFVKQGLAQDMRDTLGASFVKNYDVRVPGSIVAYDSYGGDMIEAPLGTSASAASVFSTNPGGPFSATIAGSAGRTDKFSTRGFAAAKALFVAMTGATETTSTDQGWTTTVRTSKAGRFSCQERTQNGALKDASCSFGDLLILRTVSWPKTATDFCVP